MEKVNECGQICGQIADKIERKEMEKCKPHPLFFKTSTSG